ncbi:S-adenosyl-L-methionine-dependent methyltransferases superfamily protein [Artemisia annua]|uniref:S-adenosyl-L-methionine-dependent methyltransferases superfamily protein n=1 Tax=Artemisia annua TaxID=35608 RepID=A0A2U1Q8X6_ARTAN|nr:S-adenosyl-L-methionine-dependent methyltransferases superfamily protein [Artemisia annua]
MHPIIKEIIKGIANIDGFPHCFNIADLGCSSGPNTLLAVSNIMNEVLDVCKEKNLKTPQFQVCLNDLFGNDFNSIFKSLPMFNAKNFGQCFISGVPGSFYGRLFPDQSMHLFHSSCSLHWLSQEISIGKMHKIIRQVIKSIANLDGFLHCYNFADLGCSSGPNTLLVVSNIINEVHAVCKDKNLKTPQFQLPGSFYGRLFPDKSMHLFHSSCSLHGLSQLPEGLEINGLNVYMSKTSPPIIYEMCRMQFEKDFTMYLESRSKEIIHGGHMVLSIAE